MEPGTRLGSYECPEHGANLTKDVKRPTLVFATILWATLYLGPGIAEAQDLRDFR